MRSRWAKTTSETTSLTVCCLPSVRLKSFIRRWWTSITTWLTRTISSKGSRQSTCTWTIWTRERKGSNRLSSRSSSASTTATTWYFLPSRISSERSRLLAACGTTMALRSSRPLTLNSKRKSVRTRFAMSKICSALTSFQSTPRKAKCWRWYCSF